MIEENQVIELFIAYSREDINYLNELQKYLKPDLSQAKDFVN